MSNEDNIKFEESDEITLVMSKPHMQKLFNEVLDLDVSAVLVTDESMLSDFSLRVVSNVEEVPGESYRDILKKCDAYLLSKINEHFGVVLTTVVINLTTLEALLSNQPPSIH